MRFLHFPEFTVQRERQLSAALSLTLVALAQGASANPTNTLNNDTVVRSVNPQVVQHLVEFWHWNSRASFGGSFPGWAVPANALGHEFFFQQKGPKPVGAVGKRGMAVEDCTWVEVRMQRHPSISNADIAWASRQTPGFDLFVQRGWGVEASCKIHLGSGITVRELHRQLLDFLKRAIPIVDRLTGGKSNR